MLRVSCSELKAGVTGGETFAKFGIFTSMRIHVLVFCLMTRCWDVVGYQHFWGSCCLHLHFALKKRWHPTRSEHRIMTQKIMTTEIFIFGKF